MEADPPWVHSPRAEGPGKVKVGGRARSPGEGEVRLRSYVNMAMGISTRDKRLGFYAGEEGSISVDAQLFLVGDVVVREDGRLLITADEIRVVREAVSRFTDESESPGSELERDTFNTIVWTHSMEQSPITHA